MCQVTQALLVCMCGLSFGLAACTSSEPGALDAQIGPPPVAEKRPKTITVHGDSRVDDYFWLKDKGDPHVMAYLKAEDACADAVMKPTAAFQNALYNEMVGHIKETDDTVPYRRGDYFYYQSLVSPSSVFDYDMNTRKATLMKETEVPGGFDKKNYVTERVFATAANGVKIPISLVYRHGVPHDGSAPLLLYGYGSYGASIPPTFSSNRLPLLDRGMIYAIASIRGGGELGKPWRDAGRMMNKITTFTDFITSAEFLIAQRYTSSKKLVIQGGSAGGMLMGAATNLRPDLFKAVIAQVPFVDVLNTMLDATLPLTTSECVEWGNPNEKPAYDYMAKYSPYDNVKAQAYPAMLVKVSVNDSQVPVLGRGEAHGEDSCAEYRQESAPAESEFRCRPWWRVRALRRVEGDGVQLGVRVVAGRNHEVAATSLSKL